MERPSRRWPIRFDVDPDHVERIADLLAHWELGAVHRVRATARRALLSEPEYLVVSELAIRADGLTGAQLCGITGIGSGGMSGILTRMEEQDLIERDPDPSDGRGIVARATAAGRDLVADRDEDPLARLSVARILDGLSADRIGLLAELLGLFADRTYRRSRDLRDLPPLR